MYRGVLYEPVIIVHGGAGTVGIENHSTCIAGVKDAVKAGYACLANKGDAVSSVEIAVKVLEDNPVFNAGHGSTLTEDGRVEMDAIIIRGDTMESGAVTVVTNFKNPISLARVVMEKTKHNMLSGRGAEALAKQHCLELRDNKEFVTERRLQALQRIQNKDADVDLFTGETVGAVALDCYGNFAIASSTGGRLNKMSGRVGDTPLIGCGGICDNNVGGVTVTGNGELIMRVCLSRHITGLMSSGLSVEDATDKSLQYMNDRICGTAGVIAIDKQGKFVSRTTTPEMSWAAIRGNELCFGIKSDDAFCEHIDSFIQ